MKEARPANIRSLLLTALILSSSAFQAHAYYHPDEGRWLSRDPITDYAFRSRYNPDPFDEGRPRREDANVYVFVNNSPFLYADPLGLFTIQGGGANAQAISQALQAACNRVNSMPDCLVSPRYKRCISRFCSGNTTVIVDTSQCQANANLWGHASWWIFNRNAIGLCASNIGNNPTVWGSTTIHEFGHLCGMVETHAYQVSDWYRSTTTPPTVRHGYWGDGCKCGEVQYR